MDDKWPAPGVRGEERLASLRPPRPSTDMPATAPTKRFTLTREVVLGVVLLLVGAIVAVVLIGRSEPHAVADQVVPASNEGEVAPLEISDGQAYFSAFVETGSYPPRIGRGDTVVVVVTPQSSNDGTTRMLQDVVRVVDVVEEQSATNGAVVTLLGPQGTVRDIADAGSVHLAIVKVAD